MAGVRAKNKIQFSMWFPDDLKKRAADHAEQNGTNLSQMITDLLSEELDAADQKKIAQASKKRGSRSRGSK